MKTVAVPVEPTEEMILAGAKNFGGCRFDSPEGRAARRAWKDMLAAAPPPPEPANNQPRFYHREAISYAREMGLPTEFPENAALDAIINAGSLGQAKRIAMQAKNVAPADDWQQAALRVGEELSAPSGSPWGYYTMTAEQWRDWAIKAARENPHNAAATQGVRLDPNRSAHSGTGDSTAGSAEVLSASAAAPDAILRISPDEKTITYRGTPYFKGGITSSEAVSACSRCGKVGVKMDDGHTCITVGKISGAVTSGLTLGPGTTATKLVMGNAGGTNIIAAVPDTHLREQIADAQARQVKGEVIPGDAELAHYDDKTPERRVAQRRSRFIDMMGNDRVRRFGLLDRRQNAAGQEPVAKRLVESPSVSNPVPAAPVKHASGVNGNVVCHAPGDRCLGCDHHYGKAAECKYKEIAPASTLPLSAEQLKFTKPFIKDSCWEGDLVYLQALHAITLKEQLAKNDGEIARLNIHAKRNALRANDAKERAEKAKADAAKYQAAWQAVAADLEEVETELSELKSRVK